MCVLVCNNNNQRKGEIHLGRLERGNMGKNVGRKRKRRNKVIIFELTIKIKNKNKKQELLLLVKIQNHSTISENSLISYKTKHTFTIRFNNCML